MEQFDEFSNLLINNKTLKYLKLYDVYINLQAFGRAAKINFSEKRAGPIMLIADLKNNLFKIESGCHGIPPPYSVDLLWTLRLDASSSSSVYDHRCSRSIN